MCYYIHKTYTSLLLIISISSVKYSVNMQKAISIDKMLWLWYIFKSINRIRRNIVMKKIFAVLIALFIISLNAISVFAGDIPETILSDDAAQLYFGELVEVNVFSNDFKTIVKPVKKVKGDVTIGVETEYISPQFVGGFSAKKGNVYLFGYIDEANPLYVFKVDTYDTTVVNISDAKDDMWQRFQTYLHEGKYEEAEKERLDRLGIVENINPSELPPIKNFSMEIYGVISILVAAVAFVIYTKVSKKRM